MGEGALGNRKVCKDVYIDRSRRDENDGSGDREFRRRSMIVNKTKGVKIDLRRKEEMFDWGTRTAQKLKTEDATVALMRKWAK